MKLVLDSGEEIPILFRKVLFKWRGKVWHIKGEIHIYADDEKKDALMEEMRKKCEYDLNEYFSYDERGG